MSSFKVYIIFIIGQIFVLTYIENYAILIQSVDYVV